jgi:hypothetical protein
MPDIKLHSSGPPPEIEQTILRLQRDAKILKRVITAAEVRSSFLIIENARDLLSEVLDRGKVDR